VALHARIFYRAAVLNVSGILGKCYDMKYEIAALRESIQRFRGEVV
jgi:hypothetical protein